VTGVPRRATPDDAADVARLLIESRRASADLIPPSVHPDSEVRAWVQDHLLPEAEVWLVADPLPCAVLALGDGWIDQLFVSPGRTGQGWGSLLVELAKSRCPDGLQLWTFESNVRAQRFYEGHGFAVAERTDGSGNEERAPDLRYVWSPGS
jgi:GNAT superfamily N-acetyltransferase